MLCIWMKAFTWHIDLPRVWANLALHRGVWRGVVSRCWVSSSVLFYFLVFLWCWGLGFEFCLFIAGWRHALRSEWPFIIIIIIEAQAQGAQLGTFHKSCLRQMLGLHCGPDVPSTAELLARTSQTSIADLMRRHGARRLRHAAHKPNDAMVKKLLFVHSIPGHSRPIELPYLVWMDTAMLNM